MAEEQAEDIRRLKQAAIEKDSELPEKPPADKAVPNPWVLHPLRFNKRSAAKTGAKSTPRSTTKKAPKKAAKKVAKTAAKKARR